MENQTKKVKVGILGATGMVGQRLVCLLENHPYFDVKLLAASEKSKGKKYEELMLQRWKMSKPLPEYVKNMELADINDISGVQNARIDMVFCAISLDKADTIKLEEMYAKAEIVVVSNNSANRWQDDVPMLIPEINASHLDIIEAQRRRLGTKKGFIIAKPNCSIQSYMGVLDALKAYEPIEVSVCTYQAISGSGKTFEQWPEMVDNLIPYIAGEEEKASRNL